MARVALAAGQPQPAETSSDHPPFPLRWSMFYSAGNLGAGLIFSFTNYAVPLYLANYGLPNAVIGLLSQDRPPLAGASQLVVGALSDRTRSRLGRRRPYMLVGIPIAAAAALLLGPRPPTPLMITLIVVMTTALAIAYGPYLALLPDRIHTSQRARVGGLLGLTSFLGQMLMLVL